MSARLRAYEDVMLHVLIILGFVMIGAGGLGMAATTSLIGLVLLPSAAPAALRAIRSEPVPLLFLAAAIAWAGVSLLWSPYDRPDQALKLLLLTPFFLLAPFALSRLSPERSESLFRVFAICAVLLALYLLIEVVTGSLISRAVEIHIEGADPASAPILTDRQHGRGVSAYLMVLGPVALGLWVLGGDLNRAAAVFLVLAGVLGSISFGIEANALALSAGLLAAAAAWRFPHATLQIGLVIGASLVIAAPLLMGALISLLPAPVLEALPASWAMRIEIWRFAMEQIALAPVLGHGLDASRVISDIAVLRGMEFDRLPLHTHNAGLTIWLETGAVGALLFGGALIGVSRAIGQMRLSRVQAAALAHAGTVFLVTVLVGSGIWQEWLHGALAFAIAAALLIRE